jgi:hypothetical protein
MSDEGSDWILFEDAVAYVEATQQCHREKAVELVRQAASNLKLRSRTVESSPTWIESVIAGVQVYHSDFGKRVEVCRQDLLELWPERQKDATQSASAKIGSTARQRRHQPISDGVRSAINEIWPGGIPCDLLAKERDEQIIEWLKAKNKKNIAGNLSRTIQRVLKKEREDHK